MRVMVLIKVTEQSEAAEMPSQELLEPMTGFNEELVNAGVMLAGDGGVARVCRFVDQLPACVETMMNHSQTATRRERDGPTSFWIDSGSASTCSPSGPGSKTSEPGALRWARSAGRIQR